MREIQEIILKQIKNIHEQSEKAPLDIMDLKRLETLARSWKYLTETPPPKEGGSVEHLKLGDLFALAGLNETEPSEHPGCAPEAEEPSEC